jgi:hypothetical protein
MATGVSVTSYDDCYCLDITDESGATIRNTGDRYNYYDIQIGTLVSTQSGDSTELIFTQTVEQSLETPTKFDIDPSKYPYGMYVSTRTGKYK